LSLTTRTPSLRSAADPAAPDIIGPGLGRNFRPFRQQNDAAEAFRYAEKMARATRADIENLRTLHQVNREPFEPETINWFIPDFDSAFYGGINTALRIADDLARNHGVVNRFMAWGDGPEEYIRRGIAAAFPALAGAEIVFHDGSPEACRTQLPPADVSIATLWLTAYHLLHFPETRRKFYLMQDFEPVFYPAGSLYALAEETYRLGLYGLCNGDVMHRIYEREYGGKGWSFTPAVDQSIFHAEGRQARNADDPVSLFVYARAGHWRNCWELMSLALKELKRRHGDRVRILAAGSWAQPEGDELDGVLNHMGLLDYRATGPLYRTCDIGLTLSVSKHPSYLPLELMACGVPSVAFDSPDFSWLLRNGENCLLTERTVDGIVDALERLVVDPELRDRLARRGLADVAANHSSWEKALAGVYGFLSNPEDTS
jgi:glycosyltransferase involved in cell wall biosynthesis